PLAASRLFSSSGVWPVTNTSYWSPTSGFAVAADAGEGTGAGLAAGAPPVRATASSTLNLSSRSLAATFFAVSASRYAPTCTQNGETPVAGLEPVVVDVAGARLGAGGRLLCAGGH